MLGFSTLRRPKPTRWQLIAASRCAHLVHAVTACVAIAACHGKSPVLSKPDASGDPTHRRPSTVEWAGCASVRTGPVCELGSHRELTLWVEGPVLASWSVISDRGAVSARREHGIDGGTRFIIEAPIGAHRIELLEADRTIAWSLVLEDARPHVDIDRWVALGRAGRYADALAGLERLLATCSPDERGRVNAAIGRMALPLGRFDRVAPAFRAAMAAARAEGRTSDVIQDGAALIWAYVWQNPNFVVARALLDEIRGPGETYPEGRAWLDFHRGLLAASTGDVRTALEKYRATQHRAERLRLDSLAGNASTEIANQLTAMGRIDEALTRLRASPAPLDPCARATWALNVAWTLTQQAVRRFPTGQRDAEVTSALGVADDATRTCPDPHRRLLAAINATEFALDRDSDAEVGRAIQTIQGLPVEHGALLAGWRANVMGRWFLRQREPERALRAFDEQVLSARGAGLMEEAFRGEVGAGRALLALGHRAVAVSRLRAAQALLEHMLRGIPLGEGRGSFLGGHDEAVRYLVATLVDGRDFSGALRVARWARAAELAHASRLDRLARLSAEARRQWDEATGNYRRIRSEIEHQAEEDWTVPRAELMRLRNEREVRAQQARGALDEAYRLLMDGGGAARGDPASRADGDGRNAPGIPDHAAEDAGALPEPATGEVYLAFFPGPASQWFAFAATAKTVRVRRIDPLNLASSAAAASVLALFDTELAEARRVRLLPYGEADRVDWHAVLWNGRPLLASVEVEYGLDIRARAKPFPISRETEASALVIADPSGDLPLAIPEADSVVRALAAWKVTRLYGAQATRAATLAGLSRAEIFHYAGHADVTGTEGFSSALLLKGNSRVELGDLLAAPAVPTLVVLSACEAAGIAAADHPSLMGLAQAFIAAGTHIAIAPTRPIADSVARAFVSAFYVGFGSAKPDWSESVHAAFRSAALRVSAVQDGRDLRGRQGGNDWQSLRLLVP